MQSMQSMRRMHTCALVPDVLGRHPTGEDLGEAEALLRRREVEEAAVARHQPQRRQRVPTTATCTTATAAAAAAAAAAWGEGDGVDVAVGGVVVPAVGHPLDVRVAVPAMRGEEEGEA